MEDAFFSVRGAGGLFDECGGGGGGMDLGVLDHSLAASFLVDVEAGSANSPATSDDSLQLQPQQHIHHHPVVPTLPPAFAHMVKPEAQVHDSTFNFFPQQAVAPGALVAEPFDAVAAAALCSTSNSDASEDDSDQEALRGSASGAASAGGSSPSAAALEPLAAYPFAQAAAHVPPPMPIPGVSDEEDEAEDQSSASGSAYAPPPRRKAAVAAAAANAPATKKRGRKKHATLDELAAQVDSTLQQEEDEEAEGGLCKRERNKMSAAKYRKRRKMYVVTLEEKVVQLENKVSKQTDQLATVTSENKALKEQVAFLKKLMAVHGAVKVPGASKAGAVLFVLFSCFLISAPVWETYQDGAAKSLASLQALPANVPLNSNNVDADFPHRIGGGRVLLQWDKDFSDECPSTLSEKALRICLQDPDFAAAVDHALANYTAGVATPLGAASVAASLLEEASQVARQQRPPMAPVVVPATSA